MKILTIGGDMRYAHLTRLAAEQSMNCAAVGMENCPLNPPTASLSEIPHADVLILPNPWRNGICIPFAEKPFSLNDILSLTRPNTRILLSDSAQMPAVSKAFHWVDLAKDKQYILKNAHLTAEGAVYSAMSRSERALSDSKCLVIGYGRIGKRLTELLLSTGADTSVIARREESRLAARSQGASAFPMEALDEQLCQAHFIFSTPPNVVIGGELLPLVQKDALLMDLASPPYGFDLTQAQNLGLHAVRESGLPGRYCPFSAGKALLGAIIRALTPM